MENAEGLVLVDQHAAHERILFEELRRRMEEQGVPSQKLLIPQTFDLPPRDAEWVERNMSILQKMGIGIEAFGPNTFKIDSLPSFLTTSDPVSFMQRVIDDLKSASNSSSALRLGEDMIATTVCRHAVKANDPLRFPEVEKLIRDLLACDLPYCCPHGRPTMRSEEHTSELQSQSNLVCRLLLEKKNNRSITAHTLMHDPLHTIHRLLARDIQICVTVSHAFPLRLLIYLLSYAIPEFSLAWQMPQ